MNDWYQVSEFQAPAIIAGADVVIAEQRAAIQYTATGAGQESFMSPTFTIAGNFVRISAQESGNIGAPGIAAIQYYLRGDG